jgi:hypothetical protein
MRWEVIEDYTLRLDWSESTAQTNCGLLIVSFVDSQRFQFQETLTIGVSF